MGSVTLTISVQREAWWATRRSPRSKDRRPHALSARSMTRMRTAQHTGHSPSHLIQGTDRSSPIERRTGVLRPECLVPARAGVFPPRRGREAAIGLVPARAGVFRGTTDALGRPALVPARAGVFRTATGAPRRAPPSSPHARGSSRRACGTRPARRSSPHARGSSPASAAEILGGAVVPARAGVFRGDTASTRPRPVLVPARAGVFPEWRRR